MCTNVKDPISICRERFGITAGVMETRKQCTQGEKKAGSAVLRLLPFSGENSLNFPVQRIGTRKLSNLIYKM